MKYRAMKDHADRFAIRLMARALTVSPAGYYAWRARPEAERTRSNRRLLTEIRAIYGESRRTYGSPNIWDALVKRGRCVGEHRVARLMRNNGIRAKTVKQWRATTDSTHTLAVAANTLDRQFAVAAPNRVWAGDITCVPTREGWLYLAVLLDLYARKVVGWAMSDRQNRQLVSDALIMAIARRQPKPGLIHHTDQGNVYATPAYRAIQKAHHMLPSMSRQGNCYDNACAESFFSGLKNELIWDRDFKTRREARSAIFEWIEVFYNRARLHETLNYVTPVCYEERTVVP